MTITFVDLHDFRILFVLRLEGGGGVLKVGLSNLIEGIFFSHLQIKIYSINP